MADFAKEVVTVNIEHELKQSYLDYSMSVIVGRALPDARDGLKPVHRRALFSMYQLGNDWNKPHKKSARIVGDVIGKYHPHGDTAVYDTIVRMAQPFSLRYMLVDGQGNFGSVDGDAPAAMRYTEIRMSKIAHMLLADLDKETVNFAPNYDETETAPVVLPTRIPNLLINGSSGIAVGMATNIPPHNLREVVDACLVRLEDPHAPMEKLMEHIKGPDFPTAGIIHGRAGIYEAYRTGRGRIFVRARTEIETDEDNGKQTIVVTELPYQVNKARLIEKIAELVKEKRIEGITALRDESDKDGMRIVIELRRGELVEVLLNNLYSLTQLQTVFGVNMVALLDGRPLLMNLYQMLDAFLGHRREVVTRRTIYELRKCRERAHILEGLGIALTNIDEMIALIKASANPGIAKEGLLNRTWKAGIVADMLARASAETSRPDGLAVEYGLRNEMYRLSPEQAQAILELRLHRLTGLEQDKIFDEYKEILKTIAELLEILRNPVRLQEVITEELIAVRDEYSDERRTEIREAEADLTMEDLLTDDQMVVTISHSGYAKTQPLDQYQAQRRGGKGKMATQVKDEDFVEQLVIANNLDTLLCFSSIGKVYWLKVYQLPQAARQSRGRPLVNVLALNEGAGEKITAILPIREYRSDLHVLMATSKGTIKKVSLTDFSRPRNSGIIAIELVDGDKLIGVSITDGQSDVMLFSDAGKVIRFKEASVREMGRSARGVRGIKLAENQKVISLIVAKPEGAILTATENGYGKRTDIEDYRQTGRGGQGVISIQVTERNGNVVGAIHVIPGDEIMLISDKGTLVRTRADEISIVGRNTQGVRLINLSDGEKLVGVEGVAELASDEKDDKDDEVEKDASV